MTEKILILDRHRNTLEIQDEDDLSSYSRIENITHVKKVDIKYGVERRIFRIFNGDHFAGFVTDVKEIEEEW
jgi:hypothetical protein